jgi:outer membrane protein TolC
MVLTYLLANKWMFISMLKKSNFLIFILLLGMTSCRPPSKPQQAQSAPPCKPPACDFYHEPIEIPCMWQSPIDCGVSLEDPSCFLWWNELNDPELTFLIETASRRNRDVLIATLQSKEKVLSAVNAVSFEVAKGYIELRGLQMRLKVLDVTIEAQNEIFVTGKGLSKRGFLSLIDENEDKKNLNLLLEQKFSIELSIQKTIFHLSTLLGFTPGVLSESLCQPQELPELPCFLPVGLPMGLICRNPVVQEIRKGYALAKNEELFLTYQKTILNVLEEAEVALTAFHFEQKKYHYLENTLRIKGESYQLAKDLYNQGFKDERDVLKAHQEFLTEESALIQSKVDLLISYVQLYQVLGGGWEACCCKK